MGDRSAWQGRAGRQVLHTHERALQVAENAYRQGRELLQTQSCLFDFRLPHTYLRIGQVGRGRRAIGSRAKPFAGMWRVLEGKPSEAPGISRYWSRSSVLIYCCCLFLFSFMYGTPNKKSKPCKPRLIWHIGS